MDTAEDSHLLLAQLIWLKELGVDEAIGEVPINRYELAAPAPRVVEQPKAGRSRNRSRSDDASGNNRDNRPAKPPLPQTAPKVDNVARAREAAAGAQTLDELAKAMAAYPHCSLREGARNFVFADGNPAAKVMIIGEAPGREEDAKGRPFVGTAGQLLDKMLAAIGLARGATEPENAVYITNVLPWRPPANRAPDEAEIAMLMPFLLRHIALADPQVIVLMGNTPCMALLGRAGITRIRGKWTEAAGRPTLPMFHPAYLLRQEAAKREAWADLLALKARLETA